MSLFRILPTAGKEPSARCCLMIQPLVAASSRGSMKMKLRAWAKDFRTKAVSLKQDQEGLGVRKTGSPPMYPPRDCSTLPTSPRASTSSSIRWEAPVFLTGLLRAFDGSVWADDGAQSPCVDPPTPPAPRSAPCLALKAFL